MDSISSADDYGRQIIGSQELTETLHGKESALIRAINRLKTLRTGKQKILNMLESFRLKEEICDQTNLDLMKRLLSSFDALKKQEEELIDLIDGMLREVDDSLTVRFDPNHEAIDYTVNHEAEGHNTLTSSECGFEVQGKQELLETLVQARHMMQEEASVVKLNEELMKTLKLRTEHQKITEELKQKELEEKNLEAKLTLEKAKLTSMKLASERSDVERKQRQLERLRREAAKRGYLTSSSDSASSLGSSASKSNKTSPTKDNKNTGKSKTYDKEKTKPKDPAADEKESIAKLGAKLDELGLRIPPLHCVPVPVPESLSSSSSHQSSRKNSRSPTNVSKNDDQQLRAKISFRLASFEARKQRMRQLKSTINQLQNQQSQQKMDSTLREAMNRMQNLVEVRKKLEEALRQNTGRASLEKGDEHGSATIDPAGEVPQGGTQSDLAESELEQLKVANKGEEKTTCSLPQQGDSIGGNPSSSPTNVSMATDEVSIVV